MQVLRLEHHGQYSDQGDGKKKFKRADKGRGEPFKFAARRFEKIVVSDDDIPDIRSQVNRIWISANEAGIEMPLEQLLRIPNPAKSQMTP